MTGAVLLCLASLPLYGQRPAAPAPGVSPASTDSAVKRRADKAKHARWKVRRGVEIASEYDNNVFLLADSRKPDLDSPSAGSTTSGRYTDMVSAGDVVNAINGSLAFRGPGAAGRTLEIRPEVGVAFYTQNAARRSIALGVSLAQDLPHGSRVRLVANTTPSWFARNYLADAVDTNGDGVIASDERRYRPGTYRDVDVALDYRLRLDKATRKSPFGASLELDGGYYARAYEAPFAGRNVNGPTAGAGLLMELTRSFGLDLRYGFEALSATPTPQVMVVDEADVGRDLNTNGRTTDANLRVVSAMDRSHTEHSAGVRAHFQLASRTGLDLEFERRWRDFSSEEPLDVSNYGRRDARNGAGAEFTYSVRPGLRLSVSGELSSQSLRRGGDAGLGEIDDYTRRRFGLGLRYDF